MEDVELLLHFYVQFFWGEGGSCNAKPIQFQCGYKAYNDWESESGLREVDKGKVPFVGGRGTLHIRDRIIMDTQESNHHLDNLAFSQAELV